MTKDLRVNADRMLDSFNQLALIGATAAGGVNRPTFSEAHLAARKWFREEIERSGLEFKTDGAGNHSAFLALSGASFDFGLRSERSALRSGRNEDYAKSEVEAPVKTLLIGSHLDSVPQGGRFDGALGVISALEVLRTVKEYEEQAKARAEPRRSVNLEAMDFTDEEGTHLSLFGSSGIETMALWE